MQHLEENEMAIEIATICEILQGRQQLELIGGPAYLTKCLSETGSAKHYETYANMVSRLYSKRQILSLADHIKTAAYQDTSLEQVIATIQQKADKTLDGISRRIIPTMQDYSDQHLDMTNELLESGKVIEGIKSGIPGLHGILGALFPGTYIVGGRPHNGKTITLMTIALNAALAGKKVLFVNNADGDESTVFNSFLSMVCGLPPTMLKRRTWNAQQKAIYMQGHGLDMIVVDYIQRCGVGVDGAKVYPTKKMQVDYASGMMNTLRKKYNVPVLYGAQLLRQASDDVRPRFEHLKESGNIAEDADVALIIWQQDRQRKELTISIEKNRETHCYNSFRVSFNAVTGVYNDINV
jgi:replicative DNA helicase